MRNFKLLLFGIPVILATMALAASAAPASQQGELTAAEYPATFTGHAIEGQTSRLTGFEQEVTCEQVTTSGEIAEETTTIFAPLQFELCNAGGLPATAAMNGCELVIHVGEGTEDEWGGSVDMVCPENQVAEIHYYAGETHGFTVCTTTFGPQSGLTGAVATNTTESGSLAIEGAVGEVHATRSGLCGSATTDEAVIHINIVVEGRNEGGKPNAIEID